MASPIPGVLSGHASPHNTGPQFPRTPHDHLPLPPPHRTVGETNSETLRSLFHRMGLEQAHTRPRNEIIADYAALLARIGGEAYRNAVNTWLEQFRT